MGLRHFHVLGVSLLLALAPACGGDDDGGSGDGSDAGDAPDGEGVPDGEGDSSDDTGSGDGITPACSDGLDNDNDGTIDGDDPECTGPLDDREGSFATGISGDNVDPKWQDCFFDGNSGAGNDGCRYHTCCLLGDDCPADLADGFEPETDCEVADECQEYCSPLTPVGCDCFGCCTVCNGDECFDILTSPDAAPNCDFDSIGDGDACPRCEKSTECGGGGCEDDPTDCVLCPGQTEADLPAECNEMNECPNGQTVCDTDAECGAAEYCSTGCCVASVD
jgi:hypothetical protein